MQSKFYPRIIAIAVILFTHAQVSFGQKGFFEPVSSARLDVTKTKNIKNVSIYNLRTNGLRNYLLNAPLEFKSGSSKPLPLEVPLPDGEIETFNIYESPILSPQLAAKYADMKTYTGRGTTSKSSVIRLSLTSEGFNAIILNANQNNDAVYFEKLPGETTETYFNYFTSDAPAPTGAQRIKCGVKDINYNEIKEKIEKGSLHRTAAIGDLYTFRLAFASTGEFYDKQTTTLPKTKAKVFAVLVAYANRMTAVFRNELGVSFSLVSDERVVFDDAATDPYTGTDAEIPVTDPPSPSSDVLMLAENQAVLDNPTYLGADNYDVGHVFGEEPPLTSSGGIASTPAVCDEFVKGQGVTKEGDITVWSQLFTDQVLFHETGHQFSMSHSYNSNYGPCTTRHYETSVEPGSGATLMSYGFICDTEDYFSTTQEGLFLNFHYVNIEQAKTFLSAISCGEIVPTTNTAAPVIALAKNIYTIPKSTPFFLTASPSEVSDANSDALTYSWEGTNIGLPTPPDLTVLDDPAVPPFFRSYPATSSSTRYYPALEGILNNNNIVHGDKLPSVAFVTTHSLTVRDNNPAGGRTTMAAVTVNIDGASGPFVITSNLSGSYVAGTSQTITWDVAATDNATINCTLVDIFLSIDGGQTWLAPLATATANDGTESVTFPNNATTQARIKIAPHSNNVARLGNNARVQAHTANIFFDISNSNFEITAAMPVTLTSFSATLKGKNNALLTWKTASETNNAGFDIEMSNDAKAFVKVGFVDGNGDSKESNQYSYTVSDLAGGNYYFRLKQLDHDGKFEYSTMRALDIINPEDIVSVYPNPTNGKLKFNTGLHKNESFSVTILNQNGQQVLSLPAGSNSTKNLEVDVTKLPSGLYNVKIQGVNFTETLKFAKF